MRVRHVIVVFSVVLSAVPSRAAGLPAVTSATVEPAGGGFGQLTIVGENLPNRPWSHSPQATPPASLPFSLF